jgi:hypothetical protein
MKGPGWSASVMILGGPRARENAADRLWSSYGVAIALAGAHTQHGLDGTWPDLPAADASRVDSTGDRFG